MILYCNAYALRQAGRGAGEAEGAAEEDGGGGRRGVGDIKVESVV